MRDVDEALAEQETRHNADHERWLAAEGELRDRLQVAGGLIRKLEPDPDVSGGIIVGWTFKGGYLPNGGVLTSAESALLDSLTRGSTKEPST